MDQLLDAVLGNLCPSCKRQVKNAKKWPSEARWHDYIFNRGEINRLKETIKNAGQ